MERGGSGPALARAGLIEANGIRLFAEVTGAGSPLVLLHGGVDPSQTFGAPRDRLAARHRVLAIHLQDHGLSPDSGREMSFEAMADDVAAVMGALGFGTSAVMGYSLGAGVALQVGVRHPERVVRLVAVGFPCARSGFYPEVQAAFAAMPAEAASIAASPIGALYPGHDWAALMNRIGFLNAAPWDWSAAVAALPMPVLLAFADADAMPPSHIAAFYRLLGGGLRDAGLDGSGRSASRLAVLPGETHYSLIASPRLTDLVLDFLA
jgi:pimeloyl-ACP methyl ester carboxylesterase